MERFWPIKLTQAPTEEIVEERWDAIDLVWSGHPVEFGITVSAKRIYIGYYDAQRQLTIAQRPIYKRAPWIYQKLDSWLGWDSHNSITLASAKDGTLHVAANMHSDPLVYYLATDGNVRKLHRQSYMVPGSPENLVTYPEFDFLSDGRLVFKFRSGSSGRGSDYVHIYDHIEGRWTSLTGDPLIDGEKKRNAYPYGPVADQSGWHHLVWVWRDSPHAETNHTLCYAKSENYIDWFAADGSPLDRPIKFGVGDIIDPVQINGGIINGNTVIGLDFQQNVLISYHKYDENGNTQIWLATFRSGAWFSVPVTAWTDYRWNIEGGGSLVFDIHLFKPYQSDPESIVVPIRKQKVDYDIVIDAHTLELKQIVPVRRLGGILTKELTHDRQIGQLVSASANGRTFVLCWSTSCHNRDHPTSSIPPSSTLRILEA